MRSRHSGSLLCAVHRVKTFSVAPALTTAGQLRHFGKRSFLRSFKYFPHSASPFEVEISALS